MLCLCTSFLNNSLPVTRRSRPCVQDSTPETRRLRKSPKKRKSLTRHVLLLWKRLTRPARPRRSRRFSFLPEGFIRVETPQTQTEKSSSPVMELSDVGQEGYA
ncbi:hypothetical protein FPV67DRAFT_1475667 [Lyophyllum atratum]|nr:hypothetical protein FPV67DRAFT_1475667 [Lyophyllum atratum]